LSGAATHGSRAPRATGPKAIRFVAGLSALAAAAVYLLSGIYVVNPEQQALVVRCGKALPGMVLPGTHYRLPYPVDTVHYLKPNEVKSVAIAGVYDLPGEETEGEAAEEEGQFYEAAPSVGTEFITGDENIIHIALNVQYRVGDPLRYIFRCLWPEQLVKAATEVALTDTVARTHVDDLLTSGKHLVLARVKQRCQEDLRSWNTGIEIISANFASVSPPSEVSDAFKDVASALEDKDRIVNEARGDQSQTLHRARGTAQENVSEALGRREGKVNRAKGETARFQSVLAEYRQSGNSDVTISRFYIEAMEDILPKTRKYLIDLPASAGVSRP
jgi:modulator of FtsH protease HflK